MENNDEYESQKEIPKCLVNRYSQKAMMLSITEAFCEAVNDLSKKEDTHQTASLILLTSLGVIKGIPVIEDNDENQKLITQINEHEIRFNLFAVGNEKNSDLIKDEIENPNIIVTDNSSYINLTNVIITVNNSTFSFEKITVFVDQIIGYSIETQIE